MNQWCHHHHVIPPARISLTLSRHFFLLFLISSRSSGLHPISSQSCCMYVRAGHPAFAQPYVRVHRSTLLMSSSLLLQQCPACLVHLTWIVFVMGGRWPYSWCLVACCLQDLFNIARSILVWLPSSFFSSHFVSVQVVHPYSSINTTAALLSVEVSQTHKICYALLCFCLTPPLLMECDTRPFFRSKSGLNSEFSFPYIGCCTKPKELSQPYKSFLNRFYFLCLMAYQSLKVI